MSRSFHAEAAHTLATPGTGDELTAGRADTLPTQSAACGQRTVATPATSSELTADVAAGRNCPLHYRYPPESLDRPADLFADTVYVIGGLYGNGPALAAVMALAEREPVAPRLVFNGDFNWFDIDPPCFLQINQTVLRHVALRGNVETEIAGDNPDAGCGCAYPETVSNAEVEYSNRIIERLRQTARGFPGVRERLAQLPMQLVAEVGGLRIGIVHGDAESLAGWDFAHETLSGALRAGRIAEWFARANVRVFACSHTCLPAFREFGLPAGTSAVINNGAAGMPNFIGTRHGVITRLALTSAPAGSALYGSRIDGVFVDALRLDYDHASWVQQFLADWPEGSPGYASYFQRIVSGPAFTPAQALGKVQQPGRACSD